MINAFHILHTRGHTHTRNFCRNLRYVYDRHGAIIQTRPPPEKKNFYLKGVVCTSLITLFACTLWCCISARRCQGISLWSKSSRGRKIHDAIISGLCSWAGWIYAEYVYVCVVFFLLQLNLFDKNELLLLWRSDKLMWFHVKVNKETKYLCRIHPSLSLKTVIDNHSLLS